MRRHSIRNDRLTFSERLFEVFGALRYENGWSTGLVDMKIVCACAKESERMAQTDENSAYGGA